MENKGLTTEERSALLKRMTVSDLICASRVVSSRLLISLDSDVNVSDFAVRYVLVAFEEYMANFMILLNGIDENVALTKWNSYKEVEREFYVGYVGSTFSRVLEDGLKVVYKGEPSSIAIVVDCVGRIINKGVVSPSDEDKGTDWNKGTGGYQA
jgi:putative ribosome biogenesis GTPase RsgA